MLRHHGSDPTPRRLSRSFDHLPHHPMLRDRLSREPTVSKVAIASAGGAPLCAAPRACDSVLWGSLASGRASRSESGLRNAGLDGSTAEIGVWACSSLFPTPPSPVTVPTIAWLLEVARLGGVNLARRSTTAIATKIWEKLARFPTSRVRAARNYPCPAAKLQLTSANADCTRPTYFTSTGTASVFSSPGFSPSSSRSYSAITCAPSSRMMLAISRLNKPMTVVASEP